MRSVDRHGSGPLCWAAGGGHMGCCRFLVDRCGVPAGVTVGPSAKRLRSALHWAARNGHLNVCRWLVLEQGLPPDVPTSDGTTPFMYAVWQGHADVCEWLAAPREAAGGGCDIAATNSFGCNAVQWCKLSLRDTFFATGWNLCALLCAAVRCCALLCAAVRCCALLICCLLFSRCVPLAPPV